MILQREACRTCPMRRLGADMVNSLVTLVLAVCVVRDHTWFSPGPFEEACFPCQCVEPILVEGVTSSLQRIWCSHSYYLLGLLCALLHTWDRVIITRIVFTKLCCVLIMSEINYYAGSDCQSSNQHWRLLNPVEQICLLLPWDGYSAGGDGDIRDPCSW